MIILGPTEAFNILRRTGLPPKKERGSSIPDSTQLLPLPTTISDQNRVLDTAPSIDEHTYLTICRLLQAKSNRSGALKTNAFVSSMNLRRNNSKIKSQLFNAQLPKKSILHVMDDIYIPCPSLCLIMFAANKSVSDEELVFAAYELCAQYAYSNSFERDLVEIIPLTSVEHINNYLDEMLMLNRRAPNGLRRLANLLPRIHNGVRSPYEIASSMFMDWPEKHGGLSAPPFEVNRRIGLNKQEQIELNKSFLEVDFSWTNQRVVMEYNGDIHNYQPNPDSARINVLRDKGYKVEVLTKYILKNHDSYIKFMKRLSDILDFGIAMDANAQNTRKAFQGRVIDLAEHRGILRVS